MENKKMENKKMKRSVLLFMLIGLAAMGVFNTLMWSHLSEFSIYIIDILYASLLGLLLRKLNRRSS